MLLKSSVSFYTFRTRDGFGVAQNKRNRNSVLPLWPVEKNNAFVTYSHHTFSRFMMNYVAIVLRTFYSNKQTSQKIRLRGRTPNDSDPLLDRKCYVKKLWQQKWHADKFKLLPRNIIKIQCFHSSYFYSFYYRMIKKLKSILEKLTSFWMISEGF